ncbi:WhiB family transcriptional regulator [Candidatus Saccharibacteria bacterium]|nr:WhiB family transcriptional regulator [Candidatus Saccharibacteria bacterium]
MEQNWGEEYDGAVDTTFTRYDKSDGRKDSPVDYSDHPMPSDDSQAWREFAACSDKPTDLFFPGPTGSISPALRVCQGCPASIPCLNYALRHGVVDGVWGGVSARGRKQMTRALKI